MFPTFFRHLPDFDSSVSSTVPVRSRVVSSIVLRSNDRLIIDEIVRMVFVSRNLFRFLGVTAVASPRMPMVASTAKSAKWKEESAIIAGNSSINISAMSKIKKYKAEDCHYKPG